MSELDDFELKEANEVIEGDSLNKLKIYSQLLEKEQNIFIIFRRNRHRINLLNNISYYRICSLSQIIPEENVLFTLYAVYSDGSENEEENKKKGIDKLKERLKENDENINSENLNKNVLKSRKKKSKNSKEKEDKDSVILLDEIKPSFLQKEGNAIGNNYELYKFIWKNLYKWLLIFPLAIIFGLFYFMYKYNFNFSFAEIICFILVFVISSISMSGNEKMLSKKKVNFKKENYLLYLIIILSLYILACATTNKIEKVPYIFLSRYYALVVFIFASLIILSGSLVYLNIKMVDFYRRYSKSLESRVLLSNIN